MMVFVGIGFGVPWIGWLMMRALEIPNPWQHPSALGWLLFLAGDFCTVGGLAAAYVAGGKPGIYSLLRRYLPFHCKIRWWLFAFAVPFTWNLIACAELANGDRGIRGFDVRAFGDLLSPRVLAAFITGPLGEEAGWRGFMLPALLLRHAPLSASMILGLTWGLWHLPLYFDSVFSNWTSALVFIGSILCYTILMTAMSLATRGNLLLAVFFHWSINVAPRISLAAFGYGREFQDQIAIPALIVLLIVTVAVILITHGNRWMSFSVNNSTNIATR